MIVRTAGVVWCGVMCDVSERRVGSQLSSAQLSSDIRSGMMGLAQPILIVNVNLSSSGTFRRPVPTTLLI